MASKKKHKLRKKLKTSPNKRKKATRKAKKKVIKKPQKAYDKVKNVGLDPRRFSKIKQEFHDIDYADKLDPETRDWMSRFMQEDLGARLNHPGKKIYRKKKDKLECYRRNNKRNFDMFSIAKATKMVNQDDLNDFITNLQETQGKTASDIEDELIAELDKKKIKT